MQYIFNTMFCVSIMQVFLLKLLKHVKLVGRGEVLFENIIQNKTSVFDKKQ